MHWGSLGRTSLFQERKGHINLRKILGTPVIGLRSPHKAPVHGEILGVGSRGDPNGCEAWQFVVPAEILNGLPGERQLCWQEGQNQCTTWQYWPQSLDNVDFGVVVWCL